MPTLQEQINIASSGAVIQHDTEFVGNLVIDKPITIQGSGKIRTQNADPAVFVPPRTGPVVLKGLEICTTPGWLEVFDIVRWGTWQTSSLTDVPQGLTIDSCDIHGQPNQHIQNGIAANGANLLLTDSKIREIHHDNAESHCFASWNGPGPFKIYDTYMEGGHIGILFGGAEARIPNLVPTNIEIKRVHSIIPLAWRGLRKNKNRLEFKNAQHVLVDGFIAENSWVQSQIGFGVLVTVRNEAGKNPWAVCRNIILMNLHIKNCAGGFQIIGQDSNAVGVAGAGSGLKISNALIELSSDMGEGTITNGRLMQVQAFDGLRVERITANPWHSYMNAELSMQGTQSLGFSLTESVLAQGGFGFFGDSDKPLAAFAPGGIIKENLIYGTVGPGRPRYEGNTYVDVLPTTLPPGVGVSLEQLKAAMVKPATPPPPPPAPSPSPSPAPDPLPTTPATSPNGTKAVKIVDASGRTWTLGPQEQTLRDLAHMANGFGSVYKWLDGVVYVLGQIIPGESIASWYKFNGTGWERFGPTEPGVIVPAPAPQPIPAPPPISNTRSFPWPKQEPKQNLLLDAQWRDRFFHKRTVNGMAEFEKVG